MLRLASALQRLRAEDGSIVVTAAIISLVVVVLGATVVQVGDWFQHRRHLQVRADAAALAGGQVFNECFDTVDYTTAQAQTDIENTARQYAGFSSPKGSAYNGQFGGGSDSIAFQSSTYPGGGGGGPDDTADGVGECSNLQLDIKLSDQAIPSLFSFVPFATTHAHARVNLQSVRTVTGSFPLAIPDINPKQVSVTFVDETAGGTELTGCTGALAGTGCTFLLAKGTSANGLTPWSTNAAVKIPSAPGHLIGARVGMGGQVASCAGVTGTANSSCWDGSNANQGLVEIRDYSAGGSGAQPNAPVLDGVWPAGACSGSPYFSDQSLTGGATSCAVGVQAEVDFGSGSTDPTKSKANGGVAAKLTATVNGQSTPLQPVSYDAATGAWLWAAPSVTSLPVDTTGTTSSYPVSLSWEEQDGTQGGNTCKAAGNNKCTGTFGAVQRVTSATDANDGPIKLVTLADPSSGMPPYSLTPGTHTLTVSVALTGALGVQSPPQLTALRLTGSGSRTTGVNCDGTGNNDFTNSIVSGCKTPYQINDSDVCPDPEPPAGAADCVPLKTGNLGTTVPTALNTRFGNQCPAATSPLRDLLMMLTDPSALAGSGKTTIPVTNFADFHVVGWTGGPGSCGVWPFPGTQPSGGNIWGYFMKYDAPGQLPSGQQCQLTDITPCVAVLTR